jgi:hypothetical protein
MRLLQLINQPEGSLYNKRKLAIEVVDGEMHGSSS